jgi:hypothetical protein
LGRFNPLLDCRGKGVVQGKKITMLLPFHRSTALAEGGGGGEGDGVTILSFHFHNAATTHPEGCGYIVLFFIRKISGF